ncbi:hypothetical protein EJ02DRAFT_334279 [Clathrospora elynae]|uniref:Uncharacterized protein n=1 Tax=Clathrospora elynae TaxID=706981 RepID=A0A6A5TEL1_9PLEO|nr:hypothetical protein EJ02DRAFT_334279 [Clathrospora elynae]
MRFIITIAPLITLSFAVPTPAALYNLATVSLNLIGDPNQYFTGNTQTPSAPSGWSMSVPLGTLFDLSTNPQYLQAVVISKVAASVTPEWRSVTHDDGEVVCKVSLNGSSEGPVLTMRGSRVVLDGGRMVKLTELSCWKEGA